MSASLVALTANGLHADDWPQWMGPERLGCHPAYANRHVVQRYAQRIIRASLAAADY